MRNLNLDQLRAFLEVSELGSFSAAAQRLNLTQPAVSVQVRELEARLAVPLISRIGKRAHPTDAGRELVDHARRIFLSTSRAEDAMRQRNEGNLGTVHVGCGPAALCYVLLPVLKRLRSKHPNIRLMVSTGNTADITERLSRNAIDIGLTGLPVDPARFEVATVRVMTMVAILGANCADVPTVITPQDIASRSLIVTQQRSNCAQLTRDWLRAAGLEQRPAMEIDNIEAMKRVVGAGLGAAIVPGEAITQGDLDDGLVVRPLDPAITLTLGLIQLRDTAADPALTIVRDAILDLEGDAGNASVARFEHDPPAGRAALPMVQGRALAGSASDSAPASIVFFVRPA